LTDEERKEEGSEEAIEDLEAPAESQEDVEGGRLCAQPTVICAQPSCIDTKKDCIRLSLQDVEHLR
jgi:hypothetical protein